MSLFKLTIENIRILEKVTLEPSPRFNFIAGANGSGKSTLLEAIYLLSRARSPRTNTLKHLIRHGSQEFLIAGQAHYGRGLMRLGMRYDGKTQAIHIQQAACRRRERLAQILPLQLLEPGSDRLLLGPPDERRAFLNWGAFHDSARFIQAWRAYQGALAQRNALLKRQQSRQLAPWDHELIVAGLAINHFHQAYLAKLTPLLQQTLAIFLPPLKLEFHYRPGWSSDLTLSDSLQRDLEKDLRHGFTHSGPHRADLVIKSDRGLAREFVSRGQLKLIVVAMKLAQLHCHSLNPERNSDPLILFDDFMAELDPGNRRLLLDFLASLNLQAFLSATEFGSLDHRYPEQKMFHVKHGRIEEAS